MRCLRLKRAVRAPACLTCHRAISVTCTLLPARSTTFSPPVVVTHQPHFFACCSLRVASSLRGTAAAGLGSRGGCWCSCVARMSRGRVSARRDGRCCGGGGLHNQLVLNLAQVQLEVVPHELLPPVLEVKEDVLPDVFLRGASCCTASLHKQ